MDVKTRTNRERLLGTICSLVISPTNPALIGEVPFAEMTSKNIRRLRDRKADTPMAAKRLAEVSEGSFQMGRRG
jgi:hypothetical protein